MRPGADPHAGETRDTMVGQAVGDLNVPDHRESFFPQLQTTLGAAAAGAVRPSRRPRRRWLRLAAAAIAICAAASLALLWAGRTPVHIGTPPPAYAFESRGVAAPGVHHLDLSSAAHSSAPEGDELVLQSREIPVVGPLSRGRRLSLHLAATNDRYAALISDPTGGGDQTSWGGSITLTDLESGASRVVVPAPRTREEGQVRPWLVASAWLTDHWLLWEERDDHRAMITPAAVLYAARIEDGLRLGPAQVVDRRALSREQLKSLDRPADDKGWPATTAYDGIAVGGDRIACATYAAWGANRGVWVKDLTTGDRRRLATGPEPSVAFDGRQICTVSATSSSRFDISVFGEPGTRPQHASITMTVPEGGSLRLAIPGWPAASRGRIAIPAVFFARSGGSEQILATLVMSPAGELVSLGTDTTWPRFAGGYLFADREDPAQFTPRGTLVAFDPGNGTMRPVRLAGSDETDRFILPRTAAGDDRLVVGVFEVTSGGEVTGIKALRVVDAFP